MIIAISLLCLLCFVCGYLQVSRNGERPKFAKHCITWNTNTIQRFKRYGDCVYLYVATPLSLPVLHNKNNRLRHRSHAQTVSPPAFILNRFRSFSCQSCLVQSRLSEQQERSSRVTFRRWTTPQTCICFFPLQHFSSRWLINLCRKLVYDSVVLQQIHAGGPFKSGDGVRL